MLGDAVQNQTDKELLVWLDSVPFSKLVKNLTRDFSDAGNYRAAITVPRNYVGMERRSAVPVPFVR